MMASMSQDALKSAIIVTVFTIIVNFDTILRLSCYSYNSFFSRKQKQAYCYGLD